jgi:uncharacterized protein YggE
MMKYLLAAAFGFALVRSAVAQTALTLSANGSATVAPDEMVGSLTVEVSAADAASAAAEANGLMARALAQARATAGVAATTADYQESETSDQNGRPNGFQVSQTLNLTMAAPGGVPPIAFTTLVGRLQQEGLLLNQLDGELSAAGAAAAQRTALSNAIGQLQANAGAVAAILRERVGDFRTLDVSFGMPGPVMPERAMTMAVTAPPPQAAPGPVTVIVTVNAGIDLNAR